MAQIFILMAESNPLISIIVPAYNAEAYLPETLDSIFLQEVSFPLEVIVINDGSTDSTLSLLQKYKLEYQNLTVITTENKGPANARNEGIQAALGKYLMFVDSDDALKKPSLEELAQFLKQREIDLVIFGFQIFNQQSQKEFSYIYESVYLDSPEMIGEHLLLLYQKNMLNQIWNKVYRREMIIKNKISFLPFHYGEDRLFVFEVLKHARSIQVLNNAYYYYYMRNNDSLVNKYYEDKFKVCCLIDQRIIDLAKQYQAINVEKMEILNYMYVKSVISCTTNLHSRTCPLLHRQKRKVLKEIINYPRVIQALEDLPKQADRKFLLLAKVLSLQSVTILYFVTFWATKIMKIAPTAFMKAKHAENLIKECDENK